MLGGIGHLVFLKLHQKTSTKRSPLTRKPLSFIHLVNPQKCCHNLKGCFFSDAKKVNKNSPTSFFFNPNHFFMMLTNLGSPINFQPTSFQPLESTTLMDGKHLSGQRLKVGSFSVGTSASHSHNRVIHLRWGDHRRFVRRLWRIIPGLSA